MLKLPVSIGVWTIGREVIAWDDGGRSWTCVILNRCVAIGQKSMSQRLSIHIVVGRATSWFPQQRALF